MPSSRSTRAVRGLVAAAFATFAALFSHVIAGGAMPGTLGIVVPLVFSAFVCVLFAGQRLSLPRLTLSVAVSQFLFHALFMLGTVQDFGPSPAMSGHAAHGPPFVLDAAALPMVHGAHSQPEMWVAHGIAGLTTVAVLHWAEKLLTALDAVKTYVLTRLMPAAPTGVAAPKWLACLLRRCQEASINPLGVYPTTMRLRGPPALSCL
ncbi:MAG: hypothetical protein IT190_05150 [Microbacteriaceae bacterium]|nr:hypothetical protein [Microbacteriaceae bacterium]